MFDVGFTELVLILVVSLLVLGPERLPGAIRTAGLWIARLRRSFNEIRTEIEREAHFDEIKRDLHNQSILDSLKGTADDLGKLRNLPYDVSDVVARHPGPGSNPNVGSKPGGATQPDDAHQAVEREAISEPEGVEPRMPTTESAPPSDAPRGSRQP